METLAKEDVSASHKLFMDTVLPIMEEVVPPRVMGKRFGKSRKIGDVYGESWEE